MDAVGNAFPIAAAIALSPFPIVAATLVVGSPKGRVAGPLFLLGWAVGLVVLSAASALLVSSVAEAGSSGRLLLDWLRITVALLLFWAAYQKWRSRPRVGEAPERPTWLDAFSEMNPAGAFRMGGLLGGANPKNIGLVLAAMSSLAHEPISAKLVVLEIAILVAIGSSTVAAIVAGHALGGDKAAGGLDAVKEFMIRNNSVILMVVFTLIGMSVLGTGISGLAADQ
ncbi:GAP family protein [Aminobacter sp. AP02]|uniref:GAP family protein n=1 Tax=Aminobacter sp. AP02 TaxID=2135737 RepID=UPI000D6B88AC|nr:GAP family protein [Aminobacter sp. AP02]PWK73867.1 threonine/homoserine/homoserine lactone efflux protein [Aminobacter sp. AP02]